jgi:hypothetical protein
MAVAIDFSAGYALAPDLAIVQRNDSTIQIGTEPPRRVLIADAPPQAAGVLAHLADAERLSDAIAQLGGDAREWQRVFRRLAAAHLLEPRGAGAVFPPRLTGEWMTLIHRVGRPVADRILAVRADATVVVEGTGVVADMVGGLLDSAGIGRVHQWGGPGAASDADPAVHTGVSGRVTHGVRYHRPASQLRPDMTVLAGPQPATAGRLGQLVSAVLPHLPVRVTSARLVVGPLVLPGRSTCVNCIDQHRRDADPEWNAVTAAVPPRPSALLANAAATLAAAQVLDFVDAVRRPTGIGATIEQAAGSSYPLRRRWPMHDACGCRNMAVLPLPRSAGAAPVADTAAC